MPSSLLIDNQSPISVSQKIVGKTILPKWFVITEMKLCNDRNLGTTTVEYFLVFENDQKCLI